VSNVSFSFRGNDPVREAIHTVFLYHAIKAGMDMGIVNAGMVGVYDELEPVLRERVEDVVLNRRPAALRWFPRRGFWLKTPRVPHRLADPFPACPPCPRPRVASSSPA